MIYFSKYYFVLVTLYVLRKKLTSHLGAFVPVCNL